MPRQMAQVTNVGGLCLQNHNYLIGSEASNVGYLDPQGEGHLLRRGAGIRGNSGSEAGTPEKQCTWIQGLSGGLILRGLKYISKFDLFWAIWSPWWLPRLFPGIVGLHFFWFLGSDYATIKPKKDIFFLVWGVTQLPKSAKATCGL